MVMKLRLEIKTRSQRYDINTPRARDGPKYTKYKICLNMMMVICIRKHVNTFSVYEEILY